MGVLRNVENTMDRACDKRGSSMWNRKYKKKTAAKNEKKKMAEISGS